jgi:hypothetical protein
MKKLPTSCAVVVFLAALAYQADATIVTLTKDIGTPGTLSAAEFNRLTDYDLTAENDITLSNILGASFGSLTCDGSELPKYNPIIDIAVINFDEDLSAGNYILDAVYARDNYDLILPTIPAAMPGGLILEEKGFPEYNPMPDVSTFFYYKDLFAVSDILNIVYLRNNHGTILTTSRAMFSSLIFRDFDLPYYNPISNIAILFFDEELFVGNQLFDMVYIPGSNIIPSAASDATLEDLTFENRGLIENAPTTSITALHLGESIFANIGNLYITTDGFATPEPAPIAILGLGSLYLLRKRKGMQGRPMCLPAATLRRQSYGASATTSGYPSRRGHAATGPVSMKELI